MKISAEEISFSSLIEIESFCNELELFGIVQFVEPIKDNSDNILIKEKINVKESALKKLETMDGHYKPEFRVLVTKDLLNKIKRHITMLIYTRLKSAENIFIRYLYDEGRPVKNFILHSFSQKRLTLAVFKVARERTNFFYHCADLGLLSLGIVLQKSLKIRFIHRNSFLAGFLCDFALADGDEWRHPPLQESDRRALAQKCSSFISRFGVTPELAAAIRNHTISFANPAGETVSIDEAVNNAGAKSIFDDMFEENKTEEIDDVEISDEAAKEQKNDEMMELIVTETLRIAKYVDETTKKIIEPEHFAEQLVYMVAYNAARGYFHNDLVEPLLKQFRAYEEIARRMIKIAGIEKKCVHPPSAWAYPKPRATQVLCKDRIFDCPNLVFGWDINIVSPQESFGWIGTPLDIGSYPKCTLEKELDT